MSEPEWIAKSVVLALHDEQIAEHGGPWGLRDEALLDSALSRQKHQLLYGHPDVFDLAATYAFGIATNHPFLDGNKRVSLVTSEGFLLLNGYEVIASEAAKVASWSSLAAGLTTETELAAWFRANAKALP